MKKKLLNDYLLTCSAKSFLLVLMCLMLTQLSLQAQNISIKGVVRSTDGTTLPGVKIGRAHV